MSLCAHTPSARTAPIVTVEASSRWARGGGRMTDHTQHPQGAFSWADLSTTDTAAAKTFYSTVFGWDIVDQPIPESDAVYSMARVNGKDACAINELRPDQREQG